MSVRLVILDLDLTLWNHRNVTGLARPFQSAGDDAVVDQTGVRVSLFPGVRTLLDGLRERSMIVAAASWNEPDAVQEIFDLLDLNHYFDHKKVEPHPNKERLVAALFRDLEAAGRRVRPSEALYVDDRRIHLDAIHATVGPIRFLQFGVDIKQPGEILSYLDSTHNATG